MSDETLIEWLAGILSALFAGWLAVLSWIFNRVVKRLDDLDDDKAGKGSTDARFDRLIEQLESHIDEDRSTHAMIADKIDTTNERIAKTNETLAGLRGELTERWRREGRT